MLEHVGERFLHHPVGGQLDAGVDAVGRPLDMQRHRHAGGPHVVDQPWQVGKTGAGACDRAPSLSRSTPSSRRISVSVPRDVAEIASSAALGLLRPFVEHVGADARLDGDHRHRVGDDVVQLLGDAQPLLGQHPGRAWRSASARLSASRTRASVAARRLRSATPIAQPAANWARTAEHADRIEPGESLSPSTTIVVLTTASPATAFRSVHHAPTV